MDAFPETSFNEPCSRFCGSACGLRKLWRSRSLRPTRGLTPPHHAQNKNRACRGPRFKAAARFTAVRDDSWLDYFVLEFLLQRGGNLKGKRSQKPTANSQTNYRFLTKNFTI